MGWCVSDCDLDQARAGVEAGRRVVVWRLRSQPSFFLWSSAWVKRGDRYGGGYGSPTWPAPLLVVTLETGRCVCFRGCDS